MTIVYEDFFGTRCQATVDRHTSITYNCGFIMFNEGGKFRSIKAEKIIMIKEA